CDRVRTQLVVSLYYTYVSFYFFFFQAEDGIRDRNVTGVQTCALPILFLLLQIRKELSNGLMKIQNITSLFYPKFQWGVSGNQRKIGRASCRERSNNSRVC